MRPATKHDLLDELLIAGKVNNDNALAKRLDVSRDTLSKIRTGKIAVPDHLRIAIQRQFKWSLARIDKLDPPPAKEKA